jgi:hypothetical protein
VSDRFPRNRLCSHHVSYSIRLRYPEAFRDLRGEFIDIDLASIEQNIRATTYDSTDLDAVTFVPDSFVDQNLSL